MVAVATELPAVMDANVLFAFVESAELFGARKVKLGVSVMPAGTDAVTVTWGVPMAYVSVEPAATAEDPMAAATVVVVGETPYFRPVVGTPRLVTESVGVIVHVPAVGSVYVEAPLATPVNVTLFCPANEKTRLVVLPVGKDATVTDA